MTIKFPSETYPLCIVCQRLRPSGDGSLSCAAFPEGIPTELLEGKADHRRPFPGDREIRFEPDWAAPREALAQLSVLSMEPERPALLQFPLSY